MSGLSPEDYPDYAQHLSNKGRPPLGFCSRPALMLIDVCKAYWTPGSPLDISSFPLAADAPASMNRLVAAPRAGKCPVIWTQAKYTHPKLKDAGLFAKKAPLVDCFREGDTRGLRAFLQGLEPESDDMVLAKKYPSPFFETNLHTQLQMLNVDTLVICGVSTSGCVRATALDTMQSGSRPIVRPPLLL
jgi:nicotinamidase-related amidase